ncbi:MAG: hypothetical protein VKO39_06025 [Cyanobacteriota bacterium]|nr:hypothetical protein [Cyanobacteriota bacterium]
MFFALLPQEQEATLEVNAQDPLKYKVQRIAKPKPKPKPKPKQ